MYVRWCWTLLEIVVAIVNIETIIISFGTLIYTNLQVESDTRTMFHLPLYTDPSNASFVMMW